MQKFYKKGQLAAQAEVHLETIRYYEKIGLISTPQRAENGYRLFSQIHLDELQFIKTCRAIGLSIDEIKQLKQLRHQEHNHNADQIIAHHLDLIEQKIQQLQRIKQQLLAISTCKPEDKTCKVLDFLTH